MGSCLDKLKRAGSRSGGEGGANIERKRRYEVEEADNEG